MGTKIRYGTDKLKRNQKEHEFHEHDFHQFLSYNEFFYNLLDVGKTVATFKN